MSGGQQNHRRVQKTILGSTKPLESPTKLFYRSTKLMESLTKLFYGSTKSMESPTKLFYGSTKPSHSKKSREIIKQICSKHRVQKQIGSIMKQNCFISNGMKKFYLKLNNFDS